MSGSESNQATRDSSVPVASSETKVLIPIDWLALIIGRLWQIVGECTALSKDMKRMQQVLIANMQDPGAASLDVFPTSRSSQDTIERNMKMEARSTRLLEQIGRSTQNTQDRCRPKDVPVNPRRKRNEKEQNKKREEKRAQMMAESLQQLDLEP